MLTVFIKVLTILLISKNAVVSGGERKTGSSIVPVKEEFQINYQPERIQLNVTRFTVAEKWMVDRMSVVQRMLVRVRTLFHKKMKLGAWLVAHNIELTQPDYYHCTIGVYNNIIRRDYFKYPSGLISETRNVKEALFSSLVDQKPIMEVHARTAKQLNFFMNDIGEELKVHGKLVWDLSQSIVEYQEDELLEACLLPPGPRQRDINTTSLDYLASEDYAPMEYLGF